MNRRQESILLKIDYEHIVVEATRSMLTTTDCPLKYISLKRKQISPHVHLKKLKTLKQILNGRKMYLKHTCQLLVVTKSAFTVGGAGTDRVLQKNWRPFLAAVQRTHSFEEEN